MEDAEEVWNEESGEDKRRDYPRGEALDEPVDLP